MKRRLWMTRAAFAFIASLAFATPSQATSTKVTVNSTYSPVSGVTVNSLDVTLTGINPPTPTGTTLSVPGDASISLSGNTFHITFTPADQAAFIGLNQAFATFSFIVSGNGAGISATSTVFHTSGGNKNGTSGVSFATVPEPASMSMLGIGMSGLLVFRRYFRRNRHV